MMKKSTLFYNTISLIAVGFWLTGCTGQAQPQQKVTATPPNIIILLADDLGYGDLSCYGSQSVETPHLDSLAAQGMQFSHFYAGSAVCSPSRASLLTGKYPLRYDIRRHFSDRFEHLPTAAVTLPELLQEKGYHTAHIGKWHLGGLRPQDYEARQAGQAANPGPLQHGFDHSLTSIEGAPIRPKLMKDRRLYREGGKFMVRNDRRAPDDPHHWTEIKVNEAISLIDQYADDEQPFFLNLWFDVPHTPYEPAPEPHLSKYEQMGVTGDQLYFRSMVSHLDAQIGRLIRHLKATGVYDNTIILFTSDNGPAFQGSPGPFRGGKTDLHEGGIRVPMFVVWPGHVPANTYSFSPVHMADLLPTLSGVAGVATDSLPLDGQNRLSAWTAPAFQARDALFWQMDLYKSFQNQGPKPMPYATAAVVQGKWKLLADSLQPTELFNLAVDHRELYNVLEEEPEVAKELANQLREFMGSPRDRSGFVEEGLP
jgi:arylsulfatase A-like enzyme